MKEAIVHDYLVRLTVYHNDATVSGSRSGLICTGSGIPYNCAPHAGVSLGDL